MVGGTASGDASSFSLAYTHRCLQKENEMRIRIWVCLGPLLFWFVPAGLGEVTRQQLDLWLDSNVHNWRWHLGEAPGAEQPDFDDSHWELVDLGFKWWPHDSTGWFRTRITVPETINGIPVKGGSHSHESRRG